MYDYHCTEEDVMALKICATENFARKFNMSIADVIDLFQSNGIYPYIEKEADNFMARVPAYMTTDIGMKLGMSRTP